MKYLLSFCLLIFLNALSAQDVYVHDPVMIKQGDRYYLFATGWGISIQSSTDMRTWKKEKPVFDKAPAWAVETISGFKGHIWAPDISFHKGVYYLYYSVSAFGKNTSCIGLATNVTLDASDKNYQWIDHGKVIQSIPGRDLWNAIDPNLVVDDKQQSWLVFGSFWNGMKLVKLDSTRKKVAQPEEWHTVSRRARSFNLKDEDPGDGAVEAPFIFRKDGYYYLFVSFDFCCRGKNSTYNIVVGRSKNVEGPYADMKGMSMDEGGGSVVLKGDERWAGVGHNAVYTFDEKDYLVFHAYDNTDEGKSKLQIKTLRWEDGWPVVDVIKN